MNRVFGLRDSNGRWMDFISAQDEIEASKLFGTVQAGLTIQAVSHPGNEYANLMTAKEHLVRLIARLEEAAINR